MSDLHALRAAEQVAALRTRKISSRDLTEHYLARIDALDAELGAFVTVTPELALEAADRADERIAHGEWSPLLGLPLGIKDLQPTAGVRTTFGSAVLADFVPTEDAWTVRQLRSAGAVILGKTNAPEFGATCFTENEVTSRPAVTPYDVSRYSSGSSGGAATAVAAGLVPLATGSDSAGSIRTPAATCHLVGLKPSRGLVSTAPQSSFIGASAEGPIARSVRDAALLLDAMTEPWAGELHGWRTGTTFVDAAEQRPTRPLKVALWTGTGVEGLDPHPESVIAAERAAALLRELGHDVREIDIPAGYGPQVRWAIDAWFASSVGAVVATMIPAEGRELLHPYSKHLAQMAAGLSASELVLAHSVLAGYASAFLVALDEFDIALTPTTCGPPAPIGHFLSGGVEGVGDQMLAWSCYTPWANLTGQPAISVPSHLDDNGLPHGVHLVARQRHDTQLVSLAAQLEDAALWDDVHPPYWNR